MSIDQGYKVCVLSSSLLRARMMRVVALCVVLLGVVLAFNYEKFLYEPQELARNLLPPQAPLTFSWNNCGNNTDPIVIKAITVGPDPIVLGGNILFSFTVALNGLNLTAPTIDLKIQKKVGIWVDIPCVDNVGSCQYQNVCSMIRPDSGPCSPPFSTYGIPCHCPFNAGIYTLPLYSMSTQNPGINWLTNGDYHVIAKVLQEDTTWAGCVEVYVSLKSD